MTGDDQTALALPKMQYCLALGTGGNAQMNVFPSAEQAIRYASEPRAVIEELIGAPFSSGWEWRDANGYPTCMATTKVGKPCKNFMKNVQIESPAAWENYGGGYCAVHGG